MNKGYKISIRIQDV